jgi:molybdopterin synthase sulfur carrier subunit
METMIEILVFGQLIDITASGNVRIPMTGSTEELLDELYRLYPALRGKTFLLSLDQQIVRENRPIHTNSKIALLPPFSGG